MMKVAVATATDVGTRLTSIRGTWQSTPPQTRSLVSHNVGVGLRDSCPSHDESCGRGRVLTAAMGRNYSAAYQDANEASKHH
jgi:hypothetical protein